MKVLFLTSGPRVPSTRFRIFQFLPALRRAGMRCSVRHSHPPKYDHYRSLGWRGSQAMRRGVRRLNLLEARLRRFDLAVIERELFDDDSVVFEQRLREIVARVVLDVDDALFLRHAEKYETLARMCDGVIAGNEAIAAHTRPFNANVTVIPTCVDLDRYQPAVAATREGPMVIGWTGTSSNLEQLRLVEEPLRRLADRHRVELHVISDRPDPLRTMNFGRLPVRFVRWSVRREMAQLRPIQIGIMPLADSEWERYKCGLKLIQYLALGIPAVASPVGVNTQIVQSGENGFLAGTPEQWEICLGQLLTDHALQRAEAIPDVPTHPRRGAS
jgi:glycosyltransferase involved in cell wall biosynthesis